MTRLSSLVDKGIPFILYKYKLQYTEDKELDQEDYETVEDGTVIANSKEIINFEETKKRGNYGIKR